MVSVRFGFLDKFEGRRFGFFLGWDFFGGREGSCVEYGVVVVFRTVTGVGVFGR